MNEEIEKAILIAFEKHKAQYNTLFFSKEKIKLEFKRFVEIPLLAALSYLSKHYKQKIKRLKHL